MVSSGITKITRKANILVLANGSGVDCMAEIPFLSLIKIKWANYPLKTSKNGLG